MDKRFEKIPHYSCTMGFYARVPAIAAAGTRRQGRRETESLSSALSRDAGGENGQIGSRACGRSPSKGPVFPYNVGWCKVVKECNPGMRLDICRDYA